MRPSDFNRLIKLAAKQTYYPLCIKYIEDNLDEGFHPLALATLVYYLPRNILDLQTKQLVKHGVTRLWERERHGV